MKLLTIFLSVNKLLFLLILFQTKVSAEVKKVEGDLFDLSHPAVADHLHLLSENEKEAIQDSLQRIYLEKGIKISIVTLDGREGKIDGNKTFKDTEVDLVIVCNNKKEIRFFPSTKFLPHFTDIVKAKLNSQIVNPSLKENSLFKTLQKSTNVCTLICTGQTPFTENIFDVFTVFSTTGLMGISIIIALITGALSGLFFAMTRPTIIYSGSGPKTKLITGSWGGFLFLNKDEEKKNNGASGHWYP